MNRNDKHAHFTHMEKSALNDINQLAKRIDWLNTQTTGLWHNEEAALVKMHQASYADSNERLKRAQSWFERNEVVPVELLTEQVERLSNLLLGEKLPLHLSENGLIIIPAGETVTKAKLLEVVQAWYNQTLEIDPSPIRNRMLETLEQVHAQYAATQPHG